MHSDPLPFLSVSISSHDRGRKTPPTTEARAVAPQNSTPLNVTGAVSKISHPSQGLPSVLNYLPRLLNELTKYIRLAQQVRDGLAEDMEHITPIDARDLLSNFFKRAAKPGNVDGESVMNSVKELVAAKCDKNSALDKALME